MREGFVKSISHPFTIEFYVFRLLKLGSFGSGCRRWSFMYPKCLFLRYTSPQFGTIKHNEWHQVWYQSVQVHYHRLLLGFRPGSAWSILDMRLSKFTAVFGCFCSIKLVDVGASIALVSLRLLVVIQDAKNGSLLRYHVKSERNSCIKCDYIIPLFCYKIVFYIYKQPFLR
jgi:hypothetical protein